jgi:hypothetical protein
VVNSTVIGGANKVNVFDEPGYDWENNPLPPDVYGNAQTYEDKSIRENIIPKNNTFTGVNNMSSRSGYGVRDVMLQQIKIRNERMKRSVH